MIDAMDVGPSLPVDAAGNVTRDMPCRRCSYNVRGLHFAGRCPECGTPVGISIYGNLLRFSDPAWVDKLARGVNLILWGIVAAILAAIAGIALARVHPALINVAAFAGSLVGLAGAWLLTEPDPGTEEDPQSLNARRLVRIALLVGLFQNILTLFSKPSMHPLLSAVLGGAIVLTAIVGIVGQFAQLYYLEKIALRIPDQKLAGRAKLVRWGYGVSFAVMVGVGAVMAFAMLTMKQAPGGPGAMPFFMAFGCVAGLAGLCALGFGIVYLIMLFQFNRVLKEQSEYARRTWANIAAPAAPPPVAAPPDQPHQS
jgi:hypothetical protein